MEETVVIKNRKGRKIPLTAKYIGDDIVITKKNDKSEDSNKRKIILSTLTRERYEQFKNIRVEKESNGIYHRFSRFITGIRDNSKIYW